MRTFNTENAAAQQRRPAMRITPIAAACSALLLASGGAFAQQAGAPASGEPVTTVVVSGIRGSIESSIAVKRNADSIVEAITASRRKGRVRPTWPPRRAGSRRST